MKEHEQVDPIGVFDSGVGGLTVLREIRRLLPLEDTIFLADQAHVPYGDRAEDEIAQFSREISRFLIENQAKLIVVACNSISAAALELLRTTFPDLPFIGMEPAVKPAALSSESGVVGVLATSATLRGELFHRTSARFAGNVELIPVPFDGLVQEIEAGHLKTPETRSILAAGLEPCLRAGADTLVLACTHYPLVIDTIQQLAGSEVTIIDPAPAVARQTRRVLERMNLIRISERPGKTHLLSTASAERLAQQADWMLGIKGSPVELVWEGGLLSIAR